nr:hypothetical protein Iba_chr11eCG9500 [Ipomoea batatas]
MFFSFFDTLRGYALEESTEVGTELLCACCTRSQISEVTLQPMCPRVGPPYVVLLPRVEAVYVALPFHPILRDVLAGATSDSPLSLSIYIFPARRKKFLEEVNRCWLVRSVLDSLGRALPITSSDSGASLEGIMMARSGRYCARHRRSSPLFLSRLVRQLDVPRAA